MLKIIRLSLALTLFLNALTVHADDSAVENLMKSDGPKFGQEFLYRSSTNDTIIAVQLLGSVQKPGMYHVPSDTDLVKVLALSGGPNADANTEEISVRRKTTLDKINLNALLGKSADYRYQLEHDDVIFIPQKQSFFSANTSRTLTVVSIGLGIILTSILIQNQSNK